MLAETYLSAGGKAPRLLVHDTDHGTEMIALAARFGRGLPADVIPLEVSALAGFGHAEMLAALGAGFATLDILLAPKSDRDTLEQETALAEAISARTIRLLDLADPDALSDVLYEGTDAKATDNPMLPIGTRRQVARTAAKALTDAQVIPLPDTAPSLGRCGAKLSALAIGQYSLNTLCGHSPWPSRAFSNAPGGT